ncbi:MAG: hypothetical protein DCC68_17965 [Planctomycetota bacterium]|nr:MAG: hypothetical protein DCC68_17965 [Planctomycetota bacterium]
MDEPRRSSADKRSDDSRLCETASPNASSAADGAAEDIAEAILEAELIAVDAPDDEPIDFTPLGDAEIPVAEAAIPAEGSSPANDDGYILAELVETPSAGQAEAVAPTISIDIGLRKASYGRAYAPTSPRPRRSTRNISIIVAGLCFAVLIALFLFIQFISAIGERIVEQQRLQKQKDDAWPKEWSQRYGDDPTAYPPQSVPWRGERGFGPLSREEMERLRFRQDLESNFDGTVEDDFSWPDSALSHEPLLPSGRRLERVGFTPSPKPRDSQLTLEKATGEGMMASRFEVAESEFDPKIVGLAWSNDGSALFVMDQIGGLKRIDTATWRVTAINAARGGEIIAVSYAGVLVAGGDDWVVLFDPQTLESRGQFVGVPAESLSAAREASTLVTARNGALHVIDLETGTLTHVINRDFAQMLLAEPYRDSELLTAFAQPSLWPDGRAFACLAGDRCCVFGVEGGSVTLDNLGPQTGGVHLVFTAAADEGRGFFVRANYSTGYDSWMWEAQWFDDHEPNHPFSAARFRRPLVAAAASTSEPHSTFFVFDNARCSAIVAGSDRPLQRITLLGKGRQVPQPPLGMAADPARFRVAVWDERHIWIVEPSPALPAIDAK